MHIFKTHLRNESVNHRSTSSNCSGSFRKITIESIRSTYRNLQEDYDQFNSSTEPTICNEMNKCSKIGKIGNRVSRTNHRDARPVENV